MVCNSSLFIFDLFMFYFVYHEFYLFTISFYLFNFYALYGYYLVSVTFLCYVIIGIHVFQLFCYCFFFFFCSYRCYTFGYCLSARITEFLPGDIVCQIYILNILLKFINVLRHWNVISACLYFKSFVCLPWVLFVYNL